MGLREVVIPRLSWVLGNGKIIRFWMDKWLLDQPLMDLASQVVSLKEKKIRVQDVWRNGSGWDFTRIGTFVSL